MSKVEREALIESLREQLGRSEVQRKEARKERDAERERANDLDEEAQAAKAQEEVYRQQLEQLRGAGMVDPGLTKSLAEALAVAMLDLTKTNTVKPGLTFDHRPQALYAALRAFAGASPRIPSPAVNKALQLYRDEALVGRGAARAAQEIDLGPIVIGSDSQRAIEAGRRLVNDLLSQTAMLSDEAAEQIGRAINQPLGEDEDEGDGPDEFTKLREALAAAEERRDELQALVDDAWPLVDLLIEELAGEEPAWWYKAGKALDRLRELRILTRPAKSTGGSWSGSGGADDFTVEPTPHRGEPKG